MSACLLMVSLYTESYDMHQEMYKHAIKKASLQR